MARHWSGNRYCATSRDLWRRWHTPTPSGASLPAHAQARHLRLLSSIVGDEGLSAGGRRLLRFAERMDTEFIRQDQRRTLEQTLEIGWRLLAELPDENLLRLSDRQIAEHIQPRRRG